eukprot:m.574780 g.574780  ORF g.574780 m.574780 type:complete len:780 (-) comp22283_c0_seq2:640-2979(-)
MGKEEAKRLKEMEKARVKAEKEAAKAAKKAAKDAKKGKVLPPSQAAIPRGQTISLSELSHLGPEDRIAAMNMVKEGEMTIEEAIIRVKSEAKEKELAAKGQRKAGIGRRGALKKANRGRLQLDLMVIGADKEYSVLLIKLDKVYDLDTLEADPYLQLRLDPDPNSPKKPEIKETAVHKKTRNPIFDEQFQWSIRSSQIDLEQVRLHIACFDRQGTIIKRNQFLGSMSFCLAEVWDTETTTKGWFKFLDEKKGLFQNQVYTPKYKNGPAAAAAGGAASPAKKDATPAAQPAERRTSSPQKPASKSPSKDKSKNRASVIQPVSAADFIFTKVLGRGSFGKVLLAEKKGCDEVFAIKVLKKTVVMEDDDVAGTMTEKSVLSLSGGCPFLTRLHATFQTAAQLYFVMEFVNGGDLMYHIQNQRIFSVPQSQFYAAEILLGLWYLHGNGVIYRDLKLDNVMMDSTGHIKIADFGMCKENMFGAAKTTTFCGTPGYLAPEIINEQPYGASVDFWSLGVLCFEFLVGDSPFEADDDEELFSQILTSKVQYPAKLPPPARAFVDELLNRDPKTRLGCGPRGKDDIQKHAFFAGLNWDKLNKREIKPPFVPDIKNPKKAECFDDEFTNEAAVLTPIDMKMVNALEQTAFGGFSFVNQNGAFGSGSVPSGGDEPARNINDLTQYDWYRPELGRMDVVTLLKGRDTGAFCVRDSASQPGCYALSVSVSPKAEKLWTGLITPTDDGHGGLKYRLFVKQKFDSVAELIAFYHSNACVTIDRGKREVVLRDVL